MKNFLKKGTLFLFASVLLLANSLSFTYANWSSKDNGLVVANINQELSEELNKLLTNFLIFAKDNQYIEPELVINQYNRIRNDCWNSIQSIQSRAPWLKINSEFLKFCSSTQVSSDELAKALADPNFVEKFSLLNNIISISGVDWNKQVTALEESARLISIIRTSNELMMETFQNATYSEPSKEAEFNIFKLFIPTTTKKTLICVLTSPDGAKGVCDNKSPHYKVFFWLIFNDIYLDEGTLFLNLGNSVLINPLISIGILMYTLIQIFFIGFFVFKIFDVLFPMLKDGERRFILTIGDELSAGEVIKSVIFDTDSSVVINNYKVPWFLSFFFNNTKISWITHTIIFILVYAIFVLLSTYLL